MISILNPVAEQPQNARANLLLHLSRILMIAGILSLAYVACVVGEEVVYQRIETQKFESTKTVSSPQYPRNDLTLRRLAVGDVIGEIRVPRLGLKAIVVEGDSPKILRRAVGHVPSTVFPGEVGNVALAGHRDSIFRSLSQIRQGDIVTFDMPGQQFRYEVQSTQVVSPHELGVLQSTTGRELTFITCFPFSYIGPAPNRFVVRAREIEMAR